MNYLASKMCDEKKKFPNLEQADSGKDENKNCSKTSKKLNDVSDAGNKNGQS